ncbi:unnamed protein product [Rotaria sordida]|uniref:Uncharacterized protein n=1 Tax=Rotaria sordida TaxID=392033 RepID=A0A815VEY9_9BILA|nr:unnamed protein product [Rotaria sordida]CAF1529653.1 unnamed protein product [Rotaria sordida]
MANIEGPPAYPQQPPPTYGPVAGAPYVSYYGYPPPSQQGPVIINMQQQQQQQQQQLQQIIVRRETNHCLCCLLCCLTGGLSIPCWIYACVTN